MVVATEALIFIFTSWWNVEWWTLLFWDLPYC